MRIWPEKTQDQEFNELGSRGFKGSLNDRQYAYLLAAGYKGALADMSTSYRAYSPKLLFASSEVGVWYDPSDLTTMFQDSAGTIPVTAVGQPVGLRLDKSGRGNHAAQSTPGSRAIYASVPKGGRRNLLTYSEDHTNAVWGTLLSTKSAENGFIKFTQDTSTGVHALINTTRPVVSGSNVTISLEVIPPPLGRFRVGSRAAGGSTFPFASYNTNTVTASGFNGGSATIAAIGGGVFRVTLTFASGVGSAGSNFEVIMENSSGLTSFAGDGVSSMLFRKPQLEAGSTATAYQRVGSIYDITEAGVQTLYGLLYDGLDDFYVTPTITPGTDKVQVFAGVRKLSDAAAGVLLEFSSDWNGNNGTFLLAAPSASGTGNYSSGARGTIPVNANQIAGMSASAPDTSVISSTHDIAADLSTIRRNGVAGVSATGDKGTGNFLAYPLYMGRRGGTAFPYNGYEFGLIVRFGANLSEQRIKNTENWLNERTRGY